VDALARAIESRDRLAECRGHLAHQERRVEARSGELRDALFEIRLGHQARNDLLDELISLYADVEDAAAALRQELDLAPAQATARTTRRRVRGLLPFGRKRWDESRAPTENPLVRARTRRYW
jgi:hypothetical protein